MMTAWEYLAQIASLPVRGSATEGERHAALWLQEQLSALGYEAQLQSFRSPRHTLYVGPAVVSAVLIGALLLAQRWPAVAFVIGLLSFVPLIGEMIGAGPNFDLILPKRSSQNVIARRPGRGEPSGGGGSGDAGPVDIVLVAHYDTQWGSWLFAPAFRPFLQPFFIVTYVALVIALVAIGFHLFAPSAAATAVLTQIAIPLLIVVGGFLSLACLTGRAVPGANDNGSGVAVALAVAEKWAQEENDKVRLSFVFTGCEEVGLRGMHAFVKHTPLRKNTMFINIDNVGGGRLRYLLGEGMLAYERYDEGLLAIARRVAEEHDGDVLPLKNLLLPTDALVAAKAGFPAITFLATNDDETIPHYHWHTDTYENAEKSTVDQTEQFVTAYLQAIVERVDKA